MNNFIGGLNKSCRKSCLKGLKVAKNKLKVVFIGFLKTKWKKQLNLHSRSKIKWEPHSKNEGLHNFRGPRIIAG